MQEKMFLIALKAIYFQYCLTQPLKNLLWVRLVANEKEQDLKYELLNKRSKDCQ